MHFLGTLYRRGVLFVGLHNCIMVNYGVALQIGACSWRQIAAPTGAELFSGGTFAERVMRSIVVRLLSWRFT